YTTLFRSHRGGGGHAERLVHVPGHCGGGAPELDDLRLTQLDHGDLRGGGGDLLRAVGGRGDGGLRGGGGALGGLGAIGVHGGGVLRGLGGRRGGGLGGGGGVRGALGRLGALRSGRRRPAGVRRRRRGVLRGTARGGGGRVRRRRRRGGLGGGLGGGVVGGRRALGGEVLRPAGIDARGILAPLLAECVHEPLIRAELRGVGVLCLL